MKINISWLKNMFGGKIFRYIIFLPAFYVVFILSNLIITPIISLFFDLIGIILSLMNEPKSFFGEFIFEPALIICCCSIISLKSASKIYPGYNKIIPIVLCSILTLILIISSIYLINDLSTTIGSFKLFSGSLPKFKLYLLVFSNLVGYSFAVYNVLKE